MTLSSMIKDITNDPPLTDAISPAHSLEQSISLDAPSLIQNFVKDQADSEDFKARLSESGILPEERGSRDSFDIRLEISGILVSKM